MTILRGSALTRRLRSETVGRGPARNRSLPGKPVLRVSRRRPAVVDVCNKPRGM
jgi:hypothetical protein